MVCNKMDLTLFVILVSISLVSSEWNDIEKEEKEEQERMINETLAKYGNPQDYEKLNLPGAELQPRRKINKSITDLKQDDNGYTLKVSTIRGRFVYTSRYEKGVHVKKDTITDRLKIVGQMTELIEMEWANYLRLVGYTNDEKGYKQFLIELIKLDNDEDRVRGIGSTLLITLSGGSQIG